MKTTLPLLALTALVPAGSLPEEAIRFGPEGGARVTKSFEVTTDFVLDDLSIVVNGEDVGAMLGTFEVGAANDIAYEVTDVYVACEDGRPLELHRTFDSLSSDLSVNFMAEFGGEDMDVAGTSELEGRTVVFAWDAEEEDYSASFEDGGDDDLLEGVTEDMDLRFLLPGAEVSEGDSWDVPLESLAGLVAPGGDLKLLPEGVNVDQEEFSAEMTELFENTFADLDDILSGDCVCTFVGVREVDGARLAEISIEIEVDGSVDLSAMLLDIIEMAGEEAGEEMPDIDIGAAELSLSVEAEGVLLWNVGANRAQELDLSGEVAFSIDLSISAEEGGESFDAELYAELGGDYQNVVRFSE